MTSDLGRAHCIHRLSNCPDLPALRRVWDGLAREYQHDETVQKFKDQLKAQLEGEGV